MFRPLTTHSAIEIANVSKGYRQTWWQRRHAEKTPLALNNVSFSVARNEAVAIVGINGSGKSTLVRILATLTTPDSGTARIFGYDVRTHATDVREYINRVSVDAAFFKQMSPWENLVYSARLHGMKGSEVEDRVMASLQELGFPKNAIHRPMNGLSRGQQQKVSIVRSIFSTPALLLLDEPTTGLDPKSKLEVQRVVSRLHANEDMTVVLCTHDLAEAESICTRVIVLDHGELIADGTPNALRAQTGHGPGASLEEVFISLCGHTFFDEEESQQESAS